MNWGRLSFAVAVLAILAVAAALRFPRLDLRPMHADEANQAVKTARLYETGEYDYDATDHHGPSLYWLTLPSLAASGVKGLADSSEAQYRIVPVLFGLGLIGLLLLFTDGLGRTAVAVAGLLTAISAAMVFYSRYYIQEMLLVFFTMAALGCGWRYFRSGRLAWILAAGAAIGMMHATKETWVLAAAAAVVAGGLTWCASRLPTRQESPRTASGGYSVASEYLPLRPFRRWCYFAAAVLAACLVAAAFFSMFGKNWHAPLDSIMAYANYFRRGSRPGEHSEPWYYYLQILFANRPAKHIFWSEGFIAALALVGAGVSFGSMAKPQSRCAIFRQFLSFYTVFLVVLYSVISYKTPWCALSFLSGMILLAGVGAAAILRAAGKWPLKALVAVVLAAGAAHLGWQAWQLNFDARELHVAVKTIATDGWQAYRSGADPRFVADPRNPYVYAHTPMGLPRLAQRLDRLRQRMPQGREVTIHVVVKDNYWPLPWYLRKFDSESVYYWLDPAQWQKDLKHFPLPDVLILSADVDSPELAARLSGYNGQIMESLRPGVMVRIYVRKELWPLILESRVSTR